MSTDPLAPLRLALAEDRPCELTREQAEAIVAAYDGGQAMLAEVTRFRDVLMRQAGPAGVLRAEVEYVGGMAVEGLTPIDCGLAKAWERLQSVPEADAAPLRPCIATPGEARTTAAEKPWGAAWVPNLREAVDAAAEQLRGMGYPADVAYGMAVRGPLPDGFRAHIETTHGPDTAIGGVAGPANRPVVGRVVYDLGTADAVRVWHDRSARQGVERHFEVVEIRDGLRVPLAVKHEPDGRLVVTRDDGSRYESRDNGVTWTRVGGDRGKA